MNTRTAVIFDLYGTLADVEVDEEAPCFWDALASYMAVRDKSVSGEVLRNSYARLIEAELARQDEGLILDEVFPRLLKEFDIRPTRSRVSRFAREFRRRSIIRLSKMIYTDRLLRGIHASGYKLGLLSNTEALLTAYDLEVLELEHKFDAVVLSSSVGAKKPDNRVFDEVLRRLGVTAADSAFVGDSLADDIVGALKAGMDAVFLTRHPCSESEYANKYGHIVVCADFDLTQIADALGQLGYKLTF